MKFAAVVLVLTACGVVALLSMKEKSTRSLNLETNTTADSIEISTFNGSITIHRGKPGRASGTATIHAKATTQSEAEDRANAIQVHFEDVDGILACVAERPDKKFQCGVAFELTLPPDIPIKIKTSNGRVTVKEAVGPLSITTSNGTIDVQSAGSTDNLKTSNGAIILSGACGDFTARTNNGRITLNLEGSWQGKGSLETSNGRISVSCTGKLASKIFTSTSNGKITYESPNASVRTRDKNHHFDFGPGSLTLKTSNGRIAITSDQ